jgi:glycosyltransferase involved in cell wall biosynthesis
MKQSDMQSEIASSSFGLAICKQNIGDSLAGVMPTKVAEFLAVGRPVIVSKGVGDLEKLLLSTRTGVIMKDNMDLAVNELLDLLDDEETPKRCRALAEQHFSMVNAVNTYDSIFKKLLKWEALK